MAKYVQMCNACGTIYYMDDPEQRKSVCDKCGKDSLRKVIPQRLPDKTDTVGEPVVKEPAAEKPADKAGKYMQKCDACGTIYYMDDPAQRKRMCDVCGKKSIRLIVPVLVEDGGEEPGGQSVKESADPSTGPQGTGSGPASTEGGADWKEMMRRHREALQREKEAGINGAAKGGNPGESHSDSQAGNKAGSQTGNQTGSQAGNQTGNQAGRQVEIRTGHLCLKVSGSPGSFDLRLNDERGPVFIGRGWTRADYFEKDTRVSWIHCMIFRMADGKWFVRDMQSSNGTFLCERAGAPQTRVSAHEPAALAKGSVIMLGPWNDAVRLEVTEA